MVVEISPERVDAYDNFEAWLQFNGLQDEFYASDADRQHEIIDAHGKAPYSRVKVAADPPRFPDEVDESEYWSGKCGLPL